MKSILTLFLLTAALTMNYAYAAPPLVDPVLPGCKPTGPSGIAVEISIYRPKNKIDNFGQGDTVEVGANGALVVRDGITCRLKAAYSPGQWLTVGVQPVTQ